MFGLRSTNSSSCASSRHCIVWIFVAASLCGAGAVAAAEYDVMLDASLSMSGFVGEKAGARRGAYQETWRELLDDLQAQSRNRYQFGNPGEFRRVGDLNDVLLDQQQTYLGDAVREWLTQSQPADALVVVTDNQADALGTTASGRQQRLFEELVSGDNSAFGYVGVLAARLPFHGNVYALDNSRRSVYEGRRALVTYVLGRSGLDESDYRALEKNIRAAWDRILPGAGVPELTRYIAIRPFDSNAVSSELTKIDLDQGSGEGVRVSIADNRLVVENHVFGKPLPLEFFADITTGENALTLRDVRLDAEMRFNDYPELIRSPTGTSLIQAQVNPSQATFEPGVIRSFQILFDINEFGFEDLPFFRRLQWTMTNRKVVDGTLVLRFNAAKKNLETPDTLLAGWSYEGAPGDLGRSDATVQERVYELDNLIANLVVETSAIETLEEIDVSLELRFPPGPLLIIFLVGGAAIAVIAALMWRFGAGARFQLQEVASATEEEFTLGLGGRYVHFGADDKPQFSLRWLGLALYVSTPFRLLSRHLVNPGESVVIFDPELELEREFLVLRATKEDGDEPDELDYD